MWCCELPISTHRSLLPPPGRAARLTWGTAESKLPSNASYLSEHAGGVANVGDGELEDAFDCAPLGVAWVASIHLGEDHAAASRRGGHEHA